MVIQMLNCPKCNQPLPETGESCPHCGVDITWRMSRGGQVDGPYDLPTVPYCRREGRSGDDEQLKLALRGAWHRAGDWAP